MLPLSWIASPRRVRAAVRSMHQFCPIVRSMFTEDIEDDAIEAMTVYLYLSIARDVLGRGFSKRLARNLRKQLKYCSPYEINPRLQRIARRSRKIERRLRDKTRKRMTGADRYALRIQGVVRAMLFESTRYKTDNQARDAALAHAYAPFNTVSSRMKAHLEGIGKQHFSML